MLNARIVKTPRLAHLYDRPSSRPVNNIPTKLLFIVGVTDAGVRVGIVEYRTVSRVIVHTPAHI
jgi:hypothetical protein